MTTKKVNLDNKSSSVQSLNTLLLNFLNAGGSLDIPINLEINSKGKVSNKDIFSYYFKMYPLKLQIKQLFKDVPEIVNYSEPLKKPRNYSSYSNGRFSLSFFELLPHKEDKNAKRKAGRPVLTLDEKKTKCFLIHVACVCDKHGVKLAKDSPKTKLTENDYISFGFGNKLITIAKDFYTQLSQDYIYKKGRDKEYQLNLFNSIYSFKEYLDSSLSQTSASKLEGDELDRYTALMIYKYSTLRNLIIDKCVMFLNMLDDMHDHIKLSNAKAELTSNLSDGIDADLEEFNESFKVLPKTSVVHIGCPYLVVGKLKKLDIYNHLHKAMKEESLDLLIDYISSILVHSVSENIGIKASQVKTYKLSSANSFSRQFYKVANKIKDSYEGNCKTLQQTISTILFQNEVNKASNKTLLLLDSTLVKSEAKNIFYNSYSVSKIEGLVKCFKLTLIQTEKGVPLLLDTSSSSKKDVSDFTRLLDDLKERNVATDKIIICADAGYFSQFNQVYSQSLKINYLLLSRDINVVTESILENPRAYKAILFNSATQTSVFSKKIKYSDYIYSKAYYVEELEARQKQYNPDYQISDINDNELKIVNIFNTEVQKTELTKFFNDFSKYRKEHINATDLKELKSSSFKRYYKMEDGKLVFNLEAIENRMDVCGFNSLMTNMVNVSDEELVSAYRRRMSIEHSFKKLKSSFDLKAFHKHLNATTELKCLANWLALVIYNSLKIELEEVDSDRSVNAARKAFIKDGEANVDKLISALHDGLVTEFRKYDFRPSYHIQTTDASIALIALGLKEPSLDNYGVGFIEHSDRYKRYKEKIDTYYQKLQQGKITEQEFNIIVKDLHIINYDFSCITVGNILND